MNKKEFKKYLEENLTYFSYFMDKTREYYDKKYKYPSEKLKKEVQKAWISELNTFYSIFRADLLQSGKNPELWKDYMKEKGILEHIDSSLKEVDWSYADLNEHMYNEFDERGHRITTFEGHTGYLDEDIKEYFYEQYTKQEWNVVPGHWPSMENKEDVDIWINNMNELMNHIQLQMAED